jgi:hypothetical protein
MALTRAANEPNSVLQTPYITIGSTIIPLGGSTSNISGNLTLNGNTILNGNLNINSSIGTYLFISSQNPYSDGISVRKRGNFSDINGSVVNNSEIGYHSFLGWDGTTYGRGAYIIARSEQDFSPGNYGSRLAFNVTPIASSDSVERMRIDSLGSLNLYGQLIETATISATSANTTVTYDVITNKNILYYTANAGANWTFNVRGSSTVSLNTLMATGQSLTVVFLNTNGATAYYPTAFQIDGSAITPKWQGGTAPTAGNINSVDSYSYTILKTGSSAYTVFASQTRFA